MSSDRVSNVNCVFQPATPTTEEDQNGLFQFLIFLLYPWKFQTKQAALATPRNSIKLFSVLEGQKHQDPYST